MSKEENRKRAPQSFAHLEAMRKAFGDVKLEYVSENGVEYGKRDERWVPVTWIAPDAT